MKRKTQILFTVILYVLASPVARHGGILASSSSKTSHPSPTLISATVCLPEGATVSSFGVGHAITPSIGIGANYTLTVPKQGDVMLHQFGGGLSIGVLLVRHGFPIEMSVVGSGSFMIASGLPIGVSQTGQGYTVGLAFRRSLLLSNNVRVTATVTPLWTSWSSKLSIDGREIDREVSKRNLWNANFSIGIRDLVSLTPDITFGENIWDPGVSLMILNSVSLRADVAHNDGRTTPSFSIGLVIK